MLNSRVVKLVICLIGTANAAKLPSYIKLCSKSAPDFDECLLHRAMEILPRFLQGDRDMHVPNLNPLVLTSLELQIDDFKISLQDMKLYGLDTAQLKQIGFDFNNKQFNLKAFFEKITILGKYSCDGNLLILPVKGSGDLNITVVGLEVDYMTKYKLEQRNGEEYISFPDTPEVRYSHQRVYYDLKGLFNENAELGAVTMKSLNDEWEKFSEALKPAITQVIINVGQGVAGSFTSSVPLEALFLD